NGFQGTRATAPDAFVMKLTSGGNTVAYSTYLGGNNLDVGIAIAVDGSGNAFIAGETDSTNFPRANAFQNVLGGGTCSSNGVVFTCDDAFVTKLNPSGNALVFSTFLGGAGEDIANGIAFDGDSNAYVAGFTSSSNFPTANPIQGSLAGLSDAFVSKFNSNGNG